MKKYVFKVNLCDVKTGIALCEKEFVGTWEEFLTHSGRFEAKHPEIDVVLNCIIIK